MELMLNFKTVAWEGTSRQGSLLSTQPDTAPGMQPALAMQPCGCLVTNTIIPRAMQPSQSLQDAILTAQRWPAPQPSTHNHHVIHNRHAICCPPVLITRSSHDTPQAPHHGWNMLLWATEGSGCTPCFAAHCSRLSRTITVHLLSRLGSTGYL